MTKSDATPDEMARLHRASLKALALEQLRAANPSPKHAGKIALYADAWVDYRIAQDNIDEHGAIVIHPQTGAPIENPYLPIRARARKALGARTQLDVARLWADE